MDSRVNVAQLLLDCHSSRAIFDFCGGMLFQLVLSSRLREHLIAVAAGEGEQPQIFGESMTRMSMLPGYQRSAKADTKCVFHGREIRKAHSASGGMGLVLQLSDFREDAEGWTREERSDYNGWAHDASRTWRNADRIESEGAVGYKRDFGIAAYSLHHRFYLHVDRSGDLWLAAEDGCEGRLVSLPLPPKPTV